MNLFSDSFAEPALVGLEVVQGDSGSFQGAQWCAPGSSADAAALLEPGPAGTLHSMGRGQPGHSLRVLSV